MTELNLCDVHLKTDRKIIEIGDRIRRERLKIDMTQQELAFYMRSDKCSISTIERGKCHNITLMTLIRIAEVLCVSVDYLISG